MKRNQLVLMALGLCISFFGSGAIVKIPPQQMISGVGSAVGPSLAEFESRLFAAWRGIPNDDGIYWSRFDGHTWAPQKKIDFVGSAVGPSLATKDWLFAAWRGVPGDDGIYWSRFHGVTWTLQRRINGGVGSDVGPSLAAFEGRLFAAWRGVPGDDGIWFSSKAVP